MPPALAPPVLFRTQPQLEHHVQHPIPRQATLRPIGSVPDSPEGGLDRVGRPNTLPVLRREIVKDQQLLTILLQTPRRLRVLRLIGPDEQVKSPLGLLLVMGLPDLMQRLLGLGLCRCWQTVQHIHGLVHPAALLASIPIDLFQRGPEAHGAVANRQPGDVHAPRFQLQQHFPPALGGFPSAILNGQKPFLTAVIDADDHQGAELGLFRPQTTVNTVRPHVHPTILVQACFLPLLILLRPALLQARHGAG